MTSPADAGGYALDVHLRGLKTDCRLPPYFVIVV
jgi:hypothetical protein